MQDNREEDLDGDLNKPEKMVLGILLQDTEWGRKWGRKGNIEDNLNRNPESPEVDSYFINTIMQTESE
jgi:hypothetical protein